MDMQHFLGSSNDPSGVPMFPDVANHASKCFVHQTLGRKKKHLRMLVYYLSHN